MRPLAFTAALICLVLLPLVTGLAPQAERPIAAIFPPWWDATRSVLAAGAGGRLLGLGPWPFVVVVAADRVADHAAAQVPGQAPGRARGQVARLRAAGAWAVLSAGLFSGCILRPISGGSS